MPIWISTLVCLIQCTRPIAVHPFIIWRCRQTVQTMTRCHKCGIWSGSALFALVCTVCLKLNFYALEGTLRDILKSYRCPSVSLSVTKRVSAITLKLLNLMKLHGKIKHNEKVCHAQDFGSCAQGQGHSWVRGQIHVSAITQRLLKQI